MGWNEYTGAVSRSFDDWRQADEDIRAFYQLVLAWSKRGYDELWNEARDMVDAAFDPDNFHGDEQADEFHRSAGGLWPDDFAWMLRASVIKDAVTAFEVYLEKSADEVLSQYTMDDGQGRRRRIQVRRRPGQTPGYAELVSFHRTLGTEVSTPAIKYTRALRHMLTHQRGEIRSEEQRSRFADDHAMVVEGTTQGLHEISHGMELSATVQLREARVAAVLDDLGSMVRATDPTIWSIVWGGDEQDDPDMLKLDDILVKLKTKDVIEFVLI